MGLLESTPLAADLSFFLEFRLLLITFSERIDYLRRSPLLALVCDLRFAWPAEPATPTAAEPDGSIVFASSRARTARSLKLLLFLFVAEADPSFIALPVAGGLGDTTLPLSEWAA